MERVIGDDDLLEEIFLRLPAEIVHACKPVSKRWCNLISSLPFRRRHGTFHLHHPTRINNSKLLWFDHRQRSEITLLDIGNGVVKISNVEYGKLLSSIQPYYEKLLQKIDESKEMIDFRICDSYNGLFLFSLRTKNKETKFFEFGQGEPYYCLVCNPLTNEYQELPLLDKHKSSYFFELAFAPSMHNGSYKVIVAYPNQAPHGDYAEYIVQVYSSRTRTWENSGHLRDDRLYDFKYVEWDNCLLLVHRSNWWGPVCVLDSENLSVTHSSSLLPNFIRKGWTYWIAYVGESGGLLYVIAKDTKCDSGRERNKYILWEKKGIDGSWKERFQFSTKKGIRILHVYGEGEQVWLLMWVKSTGKVGYCLNGNTECLQEAGDVPHRYWEWNIRYHTPTLFPLGS